MRNRKKMTEKKNRKYRVIKITIDLFFLIKICVTAYFMHPTSFHSFQQPKCYPNMRNLRTALQNRKQNPPTAFHAVMTRIKRNAISHQWWSINKTL